jgi:hypothetical protein
MIRSGHRKITPSTKGGLSATLSNAAPNSIDSTRTTPENEEPGVSAGFP